MIRLPMATRVAALVLATGLTTGCGALKLPPESHSELLTITAGVSAFEIVMTPDLWDKTSATVSELEDIEGESPGADLADRGVQLYTLSGNQLSSYLTSNHRRGYGGWIERGATPELHQRVYDELVPVIREIDGPRGSDEPAPRVVLDDSITQDP